MKFPKLIDDLYLADLSHRIRTLPPDEAASALFECSVIVLLAGQRVSEKSGKTAK